MVSLALKMNELFLQCEVTHAKLIKCKKRSGIFNTKQAMFFFAQHPVHDKIII
jgi:hypothetical protein